MVRLHQKLTIIVNFVKLLKITSIIRKMDKINAKNQHNYFTNSNFPSSLQSKPLNFNN